MASAAPEPGVMPLDVGNEEERRKALSVPERSPRRAVIMRSAPYASAILAGRCTTSAKVLTLRSHRAARVPIVDWDRRAILQ